MTERNLKVRFFRYRLLITLLVLNVIFFLATYSVLNSKTYQISESLRAKNYIYGSGVYILHWGFSISDYLKDFNKE